MIPRRLASRRQPRVNVVQVGVRYEIKQVLGMLGRGLGQLACTKRRAECWESLPTCESQPPPEMCVELCGREEHYSDDLSDKASLSRKYLPGGQYTA
eukprot:7513547-Pyramimonas_sp.AAC.1